MGQAARHATPASVSGNPGKSGVVMTTKPARCAVYARCPSVEALEYQSKPARTAIAEMIAKPTASKDQPNTRRRLVGSHAVMSRALGTIVNVRNR